MRSTLAKSLLIIFCSRRFASYCNAFCSYTTSWRIHGAFQGTLGKHSNECASRLEHALDAGVHLFFLDKLTALCRGDSLLDGGKEPGLVVQIADKNVFFTNPSGLVPALVAICVSRASCLGVSWTSIAFRIRASLA